MIEKQAMQCYNNNSKIRFDYKIKGYMCKNFNIKKLIRLLNSTNLAIYIEYNNKWRK